MSHLGLSRGDVASQISEATGQGFESVYMDIGKHCGNGVLNDYGSIDAKSAGKYAQSKGLSISDAAGMISDMTGADFESSYMKITTPDLPLPAASPREASPTLHHYDRTIDISKAKHKVCERTAESDGLSSSRVLPHKGPLPQITAQPSVAGQDLLNTVLKHATSGDSDRRRLRRDALAKLGEHGCAQELVKIVQRYVKSGDCDARETRRAALKMLDASASDAVCQLVIDYAKSGDCDARETRRTALTKLGGFGCRQELMKIVERFATSGDCDARETRRSALEMIGPDAATLLEGFVVKYAKSGDCDAREARRTALEKLGQFGCRSELARIADRLSSSGDCDAKEARRMALDLL